MPEPRLKVLLLAGAIQVRGSSVYTLELAARLQQYEVDARLVCANADVLKQRPRGQDGLTVYPYMQMPLWRRVVLGTLRRDLAPEPPNLIHVQSREMAWHGIWLARAMQIPYVLSVHDYLGASENLLFDLDWCRRVITVSDSVRTELLARTHLPEDRVCVISSGVNVDQQSETLPVLGPEHVPVVGTACPLEAVKGIPFFLGAAQRVLAQQPGVEFLVAGAGPEESRLRRLARSLGIVAHVTFVPNVAEFAGPLSAMDVFCLPSLRQGLGTVMFQAMA
ncbi:MAG: glycosyltransferase, partial [Planctomycetaceae bacterium]